jgi:uncharacterized protein (DUF2267 family)
MIKLAVLERSLQETRSWLDALKDALGPVEDQSAYAALRAVLHQLRDRLTVQGAADLGAQLPLFIRGVFYENFMPEKMPEVLRRKTDFINGVALKLKGHNELDSVKAARAVFALLENRITHGEVDDILETLPIEIQRLWPRESLQRFQRRYGS